MMYEITIDYESKHGEDVQHYHQEVKRFATIEGAREWVLSVVGKFPKTLRLESRVYVDRPKGESIQAGFISNWEKHREINWNSKKREGATVYERKWVTIYELDLQPVGEHFIKEFIRPTKN